VSTLALTHYILRFARPGQKFLRSTNKKCVIIVGLRLLGMSLYRIPSYRPWVLILDRSPSCSGSTFMSVRNLPSRSHWDRKRVMPRQFASRPRPLFEVAEGRPRFVFVAPMKPPEQFGI
jgi:hypothetical protein